MAASLLRLSQGIPSTVLCQGCRWLACAQQPQRYNSNRTSICRMNRRNFLRQYPTMMILPDGSTITVRYKEPRRIIKLPLDLSTLSEAERKLRLQQRRPKQKIVIEDDIEEDTFDANRYRHLWKK